MSKRLASAATVLLGATALAWADPLPRETPVAGSVIARKSGEEARFIEIGSWQVVDIRQDLRPGDVLRTNAGGNLAILFSDRTQVRIGRNSTLVVRSIGGTGEDTQLALESGQLWARAERGGDGVTVATPAATAAIRGTDWSMQVTGDQTSLTVLEGEVTLFNPQGTIALKAGEGAAARIGQAPARLVDVNPNDREQYLFYYSLRNAFTFLPASDLTPARLRAERARIAALAEAQQSAADRVTLAEAALSLDGPAATRAAVARARAARLSRTEAARLLLVEAIVAGAARRDGEAARLFEQAAPALSGPRRAVALFGGYFARALAQPDREEAPPDPESGGAPGALAEAFAQSFLQGVPAAVRILRAAEARFPGDPTLPAIRAQFAILLDDRAQAREAADRALSVDPGDPGALEASSLVRASRSDLEGAYADISRAIAAAPGSASVLGNLADVQYARGAKREAEAAYRLAIENDPEDPVARSNYAIFLLDDDRPAEARVQIDRARAADPNLDTVLAARGRYRLQTGEIDLALQDLLAGSTANPAYAQGLLLLAAGYYESGDEAAAQQALDNADRLDPNDPDIATIRTAIAVDGYDSDLAIASAQDALRRARARGGDFEGLRANRGQGSTLNQAYRLQGLDAWGRYYADATFDPFSAVSLSDRSVSGSPYPFFTSLDFGGNPVDPIANGNSFPNQVQSLLLEPGTLAARQRTAGLVSRPFLEGAVGGGFVAPQGGEAGWIASADAQGFANAPFPISFAASVAGLQGENAREGSRSQEGLLGPFDSDSSFTLGDDVLSAIGYLAMRPTPNDNVVAFLNYGKDGNSFSDGLLDFEPGEVDPGLVIFSREAIAYDFDTTDNSLSAGLAASHTFGYRNVLSAGLFAAGYDRSSEQDLLLSYGVTGRPGVVFTATSDGEGAFEQEVLLAAVSQTLGIEDLTLRFGAEAGRVAQDQNEQVAFNYQLPTLAPDFNRNESRSSFGAGRVYLDALYELSPTLTVEAGAFGTFFLPTEVSTTTTQGGTSASFDAVGDGIERFEPRLGVAWDALPGQSIHLGFLRETAAFAAVSLAPSGVVGLQSNQLPLAVYGYADTFAARWDAEWTSRFFTSLDYQHQEFDILNIPVPGGLTTADVTDGHLDRVSATANLHLDGGWGLFATIAYADSGAVDTAGDTAPLPFVPAYSGRAGVTFVGTENVRATLSGTYVGARAGALEGATSTPFYTPDAEDAASYFTTDAVLTWEPFDKRFSLELAGYNLFDEAFEVAANRPGWSRTFAASLKVRF